MTGIETYYDDNGNLRVDKNKMLEEIDHWWPASMEINNAQDGKCIFGHHSLKYEHVIEHDITGELLSPVGSTCIADFAPDSRLHTDMMLIQDIMRARLKLVQTGDISVEDKFMSRKLIDHLYLNNIIDTNNRDYLRFGFDFKARVKEEPALAEGVNLAMKKFKDYLLSIGDNYTPPDKNEVRTEIVEYRKPILPKKRKLAKVVGQINEPTISTEPEPVHPSMWHAHIVRAIMTPGQTKKCDLGHTDYIFFGFVNANGVFHSLGHSCCFDIDMTEGDLKTCNQITQVYNLITNLIDEPTLLQHFDPFEISDDVLQFLYEHPVFNGANLKESDLDVFKKVREKCKTQHGPTPNQREWAEDVQRKVLINLRAIYRNKLLIEL